MGETPAEVKALGDLVGRSTGETGAARPGFAMLSVPTLWTVFVINFLALGLIWAYVTRSYPKFAAAPFWTGSAFIAAAGAAVRCCASCRIRSLPLLAGGTVLIFALCLAAMGVRRFYDQPVVVAPDRADHRA